MSKSSAPPGQEKKIQGTIKDFEAFDVNQDVTLLQDALGTKTCKEEVLVEILPCRSNNQRQEIKDAYKLAVGRDIMEDVNAKLSGKFKDLVIALLDNPLELQARILFLAMQGMGTDEKALIDVLCTKNRNVEITAIKETYAEMFPGHDLMADLASETSEPFTSLLITMAKAARVETPSADIETQAKMDAQTLFSVGEGRKSGSFDHNAFIDILGNRSLIQLNLATFKFYGQLSKKLGLEGALAGSRCGDSEYGYLALVKTAKGHLVDFFIERLYNAMKGLGTDDNCLIRTLVSRSQIDLANIRDGFMEKYKVSLGDSIKDDTSRSYCDMLFRIVQGNMN